MFTFECSLNPVSSPFVCARQARGAAVASMNEERSAAILQLVHVTSLRRVAPIPNPESSNHTIDCPPLQGY